MARPLSDSGLAIIGQRTRLAKALGISPVELVAGLLEARLLRPRCCSDCRTSEGPQVIAQLTERFGGDAWRLCMPDTMDAEAFVEWLRSPDRDITDEYQRLDSGLFVVLLAVASVSIHGPTAEPRPLARQKPGDSGR